MTSRFTSSDVVSPFTFTNVRLTFPRRYIKIYDYNDVTFYVHGVGTRFTSTDVAPTSILTDVKKRMEWHAQTHTSHCDYFYQKTNSRTREPCTCALVQFNRATPGALLATRGSITMVRPGGTRQCGTVRSWRPHQSHRSVDHQVQNNLNRSADSRLVTVIDYSDLQTLKKRLDEDCSVMTSLLSC